MQAPPHPSHRAPHAFSTLPDNWGFLIKEAFLNPRFRMVDPYIRFFVKGLIVKFDELPGEKKTNW